MHGRKDIMHTNFQSEYLKETKQEGDLAYILEKSEVG
jgi:hypothetical protein